MNVVKTEKSLHLRRTIRTVNRAVLPSEVAATNIQSSADRFISPLDFYSLRFQRLGTERIIETRSLKASLRHRHRPRAGGGGKRKASLRHRHWPRAGGGGKRKAFLRHRHWPRAGGGSQKNWRNNRENCDGKDKAKQLFHGGSPRSGASVRNNSLDSFCIPVKGNRR